jgi:predicted TIM-barrel fold metal-dependent hydrolase
MFKIFAEQGVRFVNYFGIGQVLELSSGCTYYLDCEGVAARPSIKNDVVNGMDVKAFEHDQLHITLSMTFADLAHPEDAAKTVALYDKEFPGMFKWAGELNVMKQALLGNQHEPATLASIDQWAPFMRILRERDIPVTLHSDLGNDSNPTEFLYLMEHVLETYPDNKIVWAHMGLSKELTTMDAAQHVAIMQSLLDRYPELMLDISWDVLYNAYHQWGDIFIPFFNQYSTRILPGSDYVASFAKPRDQYARELEITSRALRALDDNAFRNIALGENYFRLLALDYNAPFICSN